MAAVTEGGMVNEAQIEQQVLARRETVDIDQDWYTPSGNKRERPMHHAHVRNDYLDKSRVFKDYDHEVCVARAKEQVRTWKQQEVRERLRQAKKSAQEQAQTHCANLSREARARIAAVDAILTSSLRNHAIDWQAEEDHAPVPNFEKKQQRPTPPTIPVFEPTPSGFWEWLLPGKKRAREESDIARKHECDAHAAQLQGQYNAAIRDWERRKEEARRRHVEHQTQYNDALRRLRTSLETGAPDARDQYFEEVLLRSEYPDVFPVERSFSWAPTGDMVRVDLGVPDFQEFPEVEDYNFVKTKNEARPVKMKVAARKDLYDAAVKRAVLRTVHELFSADYLGRVQRVVVNGWVAYVDGATGHDTKSCLISADVGRPDYAALNLERVDAGACLESLGARTKGKMHLRKALEPFTLRTDEPPSMGTIRLDVHSEAEIVELSLEARRNWIFEGAPVPDEHHELLTALEALGWRTNVTKLAEALATNPAQVFRQLTNAQRHFKACLAFDRADGQVEIEPTSFE